jgi:anti-anti-sigma factor
MVAITEEPERLMCTFTGRLDTVDCAEWAEQLVARARAAEKAVTFDLGAVEYVASSFLRVCLQVCQSVGSERLTVANVTPAVKKVLRLAGLEKYVHIT